MSKKALWVIPAKEPTDSDAATKTQGQGIHAFPISGWTIRGNLNVKAEFGRDLFDLILNKFGKNGWNMYVERLRRHNIFAMFSTPEPVDETEFCMPVCLEINLAGESFRGQDLSGLDFSIIELEKADLSGANLTGSVLGGVAGANFRDSVLTHALLSSDISGADFTGAKTNWLRNRCAKYRKKSPPIGLPASLMKRMRPFPEHWETETPSLTKDTDFPLKPISTKLCSFWGEMP
jgi:hypothetical protein